MAKQQHEKEDRQRSEAYGELADAHARTPEELLGRFKVNPQVGLSDKQVVEYRTKYGRNEFPQEEGTPLWLMILKQFQDTLVIILISAAFISLVLAFFENDEDERITAFVEPLVIVFILIANATVGILQESSAEKAVEALKSYSTLDAIVRRNGHVQKIPVAEIVPGDIVELESGNCIPADLRLIEKMSTTVYVDEALLTGESENVAKETKPIANPKALLQDKRNMLFSGTYVKRGKALAITISTGIYTEKGRIREQIKKKADEAPFPLKKKLDDFGEQLSKAIGVICAIVWIINLGHFSDPAFGGVLRGAVYYFKIAVSLAVAAIPEGLPAVVTTCLALGTQRMAAKKAIVTALPAVETLGCTNVICSDKTGTLTTNQMSVQRFFLLDAAEKLVEFAVEGNTFAPIDLSTNESYSVTSLVNSPDYKLSKGQKFEFREHNASMAKFSIISALCNDSSIVYNSKEKKFESAGQSTEAAMRVLVEKLGTPDAAFNANMKKLSPTERAMATNKYWESKFQKLHTLEFTRDRKSMSVFVENSKSRQICVKGAWDNVLKRCNYVLLGDKQVELSNNLRGQLETRIRDYCGGEDAFRCLALAYNDRPTFSLEQIKAADLEQFEKFETNLTFVGVVGILDPPRLEVKAAIETCKKAGISVIVITGDNLNTAASICRKIGVFGPNEDIKGKAFTGQEFKAMDFETRKKVVLQARLFARVEPIDKKELVDALHANGKIVAMTGDGVNDAPALSHADIGIAMGSGTPVAQGASKMILADDNFATIVAAVEEGRSIYNNTKQFIRYLICSNIGEVVAIFICAITGLPEVLLPVQLLWVNLVTDGLPAVALGFNRPEEGIMEQEPRPHNEPIVSGFTFLRYLIVGTYIGFATVFGMVWWYTLYENGPQLNFSELFLWAKCTAESSVDCALFDDHSPSTISLSVLVTIEMFCALNSLSEKHSLFSRSAHPFSNLYLIGAMSTSFGLHFVILYVPFLARIFSVEPLNLEEWIFVVGIAAPVVLIDEVLKLIDRTKDSLRHRKVKTE